MLSTLWSYSCAVGKVEILHLLVGDDGTTEKVFSCGLVCVLRWCGKVNDVVLAGVWVKRAINTFLGVSFLFMMTEWDRMPRT